MSGPARPPLQYHGGKWKLAPWIIAQFPAHKVYVEPFGSGASVLLRKPRAYLEIYNDLDGAVVNLFRVLRERPGALIEAVELTPFARSEFMAAADPADDPVERARRLLIRSHLGYSSKGINGSTGFRAGGTKAGSPPQAGWRSLPPALAATVERFRGVVIESAPALDLIAQHDGPETLFYLDPPYLPETRDKGADYAVEMTAEDHARLLEAIRGVQGRVVLSGYPSEFYDLELAGWTRLTQAAHADKGRDRVEALWLNFAPAHQASLGL